MTRSKDLKQQQQQEQKQEPVPRVFVLPLNSNSYENNNSKSTTSLNYTILSLTHPVTEEYTRFLLQPNSRHILYELIKIREPPSKKRSWLIVDTDKVEEAEAALAIKKVKITDENEDEDEEDNEEDLIMPGQVIKQGILYMATPIDPLYLLLPHLLQGKTSKNYLPIDDILETHPEVNNWNRIMKSSERAEDLIHSRIRAVSDMVDVGGDVKAYRLNMDKVLGVMLQRIERMAVALPESVEAEITTELAKPLGTETVVQVEKKDQTIGEDDDGIVDDKRLEEEVEAETGEGPDDTKVVAAAATAATAESQESVKSTPGLSRSTTNLSLRTEDSALSQFTEAQSDVETTVETIDIVKPDPPPPNVLHLARISQGISFILSYLPPSFRQTLTDHVNKLHPTAEYTEYLEELRKLRTEAEVAYDAAILHTKRTLEDIEEGQREKLDTENDKKRRKKEEDAKKSHGVKKLEKVNTRGMSKMTAFFKPKGS